MRQPLSWAVIQQDIRESAAPPPPSHYRGSECLYNLSIALHDRIKQRGFLSDIDEATELYRAALLPVLTGHSHRSIVFDNLAVSLRDRFEQWCIPYEPLSSTGLHYSSSPRSF